MQILVPHHLHLKLLAFCFDIVTKVCVVIFHRNFAHKFFNRHLLDIRDRTTPTSALATIKTWLIITTYIFEHETVGHLIELKRLHIITHQLVILNVLKTQLEPLKLTQVKEILFCEWNAFV